MTAVAAWLVVGGLSLYRYVNMYVVYRGFPPPVTPAGVATGTTKKVSFFSGALGHRAGYVVYLPPGYRAAVAHHRPLPALYLLHAPPGKPTLFFTAGAIAVSENELLARREIKPMVLVIPSGTTAAFGDDTEWANAEAGRYEDFVLDVVRDVDRRFAVSPTRDRRAIAGLSEGGYGAVNVALHHLHAFSAMQSWSGYFTQTPTASFTHATRAELDANSPSDYVPRLAPEIRRLGLRAFLYQGSGDYMPASQIRAFAAELRAAGADVHYGFYTGGHDWGLWRSQIPHMLRLASRWFGEPPSSGARSGRLLVAGHASSQTLLRRYAGWQRCVRSAAAGLGSRFPAARARARARTRACGPSPLVASP